MKKITLAKPAKEINSSVVLYVYTREGGGNCGCTPINPLCGSIGNKCAGRNCPDVDIGCGS